MSISDLNLVLALPEIFLAAALFGLLMFGVFQGKERPELVMGGTIVAFVLTTIVCVFSPVSVDKSAFNNLFVADGVARFAKVVMLLAASVVVWMSSVRLKAHGLGKFEYHILVGFAVLGMMLMVSANNMLSLYLGLELQSLALYVLAAFNRDDTRASEAGLKYFILGALSSGVLLYGISLVYGFGGAGSLGFDQLSEAITALERPSENLGLIIGLVFIAAGLAFKISAAPFHMWTPDVYQGAPISVTAFFASAPKVAAFVLLFRILYDPLAGLVSQWTDLVIMLSLASIYWGAVGGIAQISLKRLIAYSSIGHMGYALLGLVAGSELGAVAMLNYLVAYVIMTLGLFALLMTLERDGRELEFVRDLAGLGNSSPVKALALLILMMSLAGIPIFAGFFVKLKVFYAVVAAGYFVPAVLGILGSVIACFYYIRVVKVVYFDEPDGEAPKRLENRPGGVVVFAAVMMVSFWGLIDRVVDSTARDSMNLASLEIAQIK